jgi:tape measure domain-containing protein
MANSRILEYILKLKDEASKDLQKFSGNFDKALSDAEKTSKLFGGALLAITASVVGATTVGVKYAGELESLTLALQTVTGSVEEADQAMKIIKKTAQDSPFFETSTLAQFVQLMIAAGQETMDAVDAGILFGDVMAAFGKGNAELGRLGNTISQVIGKGKADIIDLKELVNAGWVSVRKDIAATMNVSMEQFEELVSTGKVGYEEIIKAAEKYTGAAVTQSGTLQGLTNRLKESFQTLLSDIATQSGVFELVKDGIAGVINFVEENQDTIKGIVQWSIDNFPILAGIIVGGLIPAVIGLATALWAAAPAAIAATLPFIPFILAGAAVGLAIKLLIDHFGGLTQTIDFFRLKFEEMKAFLENAWSVIVEFTNAAIFFITDLFNNLPERIAFALGFLLGKIVLWGTATWNYLKENVPIWLNNVLNWFAALPGRVFDALSVLPGLVGSTFATAWNFIVEEISTWPSRLMDWGKNIANAFVDGVKNGLKNLKNAFVDGFNSAKGSVEGKSPPIEGPLKDIDKWGFNIGKAWVEGMQLAMSTFNVPQGAFAPLQQGPTNNVTNNTTMQTQAPIYLTAVINNDMDAMALSQMIGFEVSMRSRY